MKTLTGLNGVSVSVAAKLSVYIEKLIVEIASDTDLMHVETGELATEIRDGMSKFYEQVDTRAIRLYAEDVRIKAYDENEDD